MLTPGRKPQFGDQFGKMGEKVGDLLDGKSDYEKRKAVKKKLERLRGKTSDAAKQKRERLKSELADLDPKKAREARLAKEAAHRLEKAQKETQPELAKVKWKDSSEYSNDSFVVDTPVFSAPLQVKEGHLGSFTNANLASVPSDRYSRMDGGGDVMQETGLQMFETGMSDSDVAEQVRKTLLEAGIYGKVELEQIGGGYIVKSEELQKISPHLSQIMVFDRNDGLVDITDATGSAPRTFRDLGAYLTRQNVSLPPRPISAPNERSVLDGLVQNRVEYASREDGAIVGRGRGMSDAPVAVLRTKGKNPEYHYSVRYKDTDQLIFDNLEDLLDFHSQKTGYKRDLLKLKFSPS